MEVTAFSSVCVEHFMLTKPKIRFTWINVLLLVMLLNNLCTVREMLGFIERYSMENIAVHFSLQKSR